MLFIYSLNVGLIKSIYCLEDGYSLYLGVKKLFCLASPPMVEQLGRGHVF